jgi:uncharacterized membrane-anchored protein
MSFEVSIGDGEGARLAPHPLRAAILGEVHARPFTPIATPRRVLHFAFDTAGERHEADRHALVDFCDRRGLIPPKSTDKHHRVVFGITALRWEQHSEFTTYTWELAVDTSTATPTPFHPGAGALASPMGLVPAPGPILVAIDLHILPADGVVMERVFDRASLAAAENSDGAAVYATDFQCDPAGFVRILVLDRRLGAERAGALVQRVLELETYRTLALLGLPEAQRLAPVITRIERRLAEIAEEMRTVESFATNHHLLGELTALAGEIEAGGAASLFRFGASRAYAEIVRLRLETIGERKVDGLPTWSSFLARRFQPAMRTCFTTEERQSQLSAKLARAADLLRTRVDVALQQQNQDLLKSMDTRTRLQLRLQQTVEGLSVAAISYYVIGLLSYLAKAAHDAGLHVEPSLVTAAFVPPVVLCVWWMLRRMRRHITGT